MNYGLIGINGKMGKEISDLFSGAGHKLVFSYDLGTTERKDKPEVLIDFSLPAALDSVLHFAQEFKCPLISGTTGLSTEDLKRLKELSAEIPVLQSNNFSVGIQMLIKCAELLNSYLPDWDVEITETHHRFKKDKPSGTALMIKNAIGKDVNISSLRLGNVAGDHTISFGGLGEVISVTHSATSRRTFAEGALRAAEFIINKQKGFYTFKDVLFGEG